jgi:aryl-alcohol dehydrogenase-like predicted oxidoreductase
VKIALGTVQFGLDYGVANQSGCVKLAEVRNIFHAAAAHGINTLDTAIDYGTSESILGQVGVADWNVVTKLPAVPQHCSDVAGWVNAQIEGSLNRLGVSRLHGVVLHRPMQLQGEHGKQLLAALRQIKTHGLTRNIGISVYAPEELDMLVGKFHFDLVQAPLNILDRRLVESGWAKKLKEQGTELHVRSAFLQGLLLMPADQRPEKFARWTGVWSEWNRWLGATQLTPLLACLAYCLGAEDVDQVVIGVESVKQLEEIIAATYSTLPSLPNWTQPVDKDLINPGQWSQL